MITYWYRALLLCAALLALTAFAWGQGSERLLHSFAAPPPYGAVPTGGVARDAAGNLYGATVRGGAFNQGAIYKQAANGAITLLHSFGGGADGSYPLGMPALDAAGNVYGTTLYGGPSNLGTLYRIDPLGNETILYGFGVIEGVRAGPNGSVTLDAAGNIYGVTTDGGRQGWGVIYKVDPAGNMTVVHAFGDGHAQPSNGSSPYPPLAIDRQGNLYGATQLGGRNNAGTIYQVDASGKFALLHTFSTTEGNPRTGVTIGPRGDLYVLSGNSHCGSLYKLGQSGRLAVVYQFQGGADGCNPEDAVTFDAAGNLYGTTYSGGAFNAGTIFEITAAGQELVLYSFSVADGFALSNNDQGLGFPTSRLVLDPAGNLYGITPLGGSNGLGTIFRFTPAGQLNTLHTFSGYADGSDSRAPLVSDAAGNLYGTTYSGGVANLGTVFKLNAKGVETVLHTFMPGGDGANPVAGVTLDNDGNLYGTTSAGGAFGKGAIYKLDSAGQETLLYSFNSPLASNPLGGVVLDAAGNLYGTVSPGVAFGCVFKLDTAGNLTMLHSFTGGNDGGTPQASLAFGPDGYLYGTTVDGGIGTQGVVFRIDQSGNEEVLHSFTGIDDGYKPMSGVSFDAAGNLYGTTYAGGKHGAGTVYKIDPSGNETILHNFAGKSEGGQPVGGVVIDQRGRIFGTATQGGTYGLGVVFSLTPRGKESLMHIFQGAPDGANPNAGLLLDTQGHLFGTTAMGAETGGGLVYELLY